MEILFRSAGWKAAVVCMPSAGWVIELRAGEGILLPFLGNCRDVFSN
jgi:hypothetical protein